jgi:hypothetical protein
MLPETAPHMVDPSLRALAVDGSRSLQSGQTTPTRRWLLKVGGVLGAWLSFRGAQATYSSPSLTPTRATPWCLPAAKDPSAITDHATKAAETGKQTWQKVSSKHGVLKFQSIWHVNKRQRVQQQPVGCLCWGPPTLGRAHLRGTNRIAPLQASYLPAAPGCEGCGHCMAC